jgi:hypothetical protein
MNDGHVKACELLVVLNQDDGVCAVLVQGSVFDPFVLVELDLW